MSRKPGHQEDHRIVHVGWLRAAVLGANDGIVSTASLIVGVAAAATDRPGILVVGIAGLVAGAMSMAAGEYVSVSSQADTEKADIDRERRELATDPEAEHRELTRIYMGRGVERVLAEEVSRQMVAKDALGTHIRDELGILELTTARPVQAALTSALTFTLGAALPLTAAAISPMRQLVPVVSFTALLVLALLGALGAYAGRAPVIWAMARVTFWGALAMAMTAGIGALVGTTV